MKTPVSLTLKFPLFPFTMPPQQIFRDLNRICVIHGSRWFAQPRSLGQTEGEGLGAGSYPEEGVQSAVLHELSEDHDRSTFGDHALQPDYVGVVKLTHDGGLT